MRALTCVSAALLGRAGRAARGCVKAHVSPTPSLALTFNPHAPTPDAERGPEQGDDYLDPDDLPSSDSSGTESESDSTATDEGGQGPLGHGARSGEAQASEAGEELARLGVSGERRDGSRSPEQHSG